MNDAGAEPSQIVTAGLLVIGDEILSGRTKDKNIGYIAEYLTNIGVDLKEVRIVADEEAAIVAALDALRLRYTYVFTTGGIGPTHDDITADSVAKAFGVSIDVDPRARAQVLTRIAEKDLNEARLRMARVPAGITSASARRSVARSTHRARVVARAAPARDDHPPLDCAPRTRSSMSSTARAASASFCASRARSTTLVLGPCCGSKNG